MAKPAKLDVDGQAIVWHEIDPATLQPADAKRYLAYKASYGAMTKLRDEFEGGMRASVELPKGRRLAVAYNFGKLSVANMVDAPRKASGKATSLTAAFAS